MSWSLLIEILVFIGLALLGLEFLRRLIRRLMPRAKEIHLDVAYLVLVTIGVYLYFPKAADEEALHRSLKKTEQELTTTREELNKGDYVGLDTYPNSCYIPNHENKNPLHEAQYLAPSSQDSIRDG